jgi:hypothetical protein
MKLHNKLSIDNFSIQNIDIKSIEEVAASLPTNGVVDLNIAEVGLLRTLEGQNLCQERIVQIDRWIGHLESLKNKAWSDAALSKAIKSGLKTAKDKEWFAQADDDYIEACNNLILAKASKKWLENKAGYFLGWHYALKTFLKRDYSIEVASSAGYGASAADTSTFPGSSRPNDFGAESEEIEWGK